MTTVKIGKQGGAVIITIPAHILEQLHLAIGAKLILDVTSEGFVAVPPSTKNKRKRYTLKELLEGVTSANMRKLHKQTRWFRDMPSIGKEKI